MLTPRMITITFMLNQFNNNKAINSQLEVFIRKIVDGTNRYSIVVNYIIIIKNDDKKISITFVALLFATISFGQVKKEL